MRGLAAVAAVAALGLATAADLAVAKPQAKTQGNGHAYGHQKQKAVRPAKPVKPAPVAAVPQNTAPAPARKPAKQKGASAPTSTVQRAVAPTTVTDTCRADPGSCQERGRGNSGDIDPYRGPDAPGNTPSRGNDCDEGGGNNRTAYPRRTNPNNPGDSPVDNDRGQGNNRCGGATGPGPKSKVPGLERIEVLDAAQPKDVPALAAPADLEQRRVAALEEDGDDPEQGGIRGVAQDALGKSLPFTGGGLLGLLLTGVLLSGLGFGLRKRAGA